MSKALGYLFTPLFLFLFWSVLCIFHPLLVAANRLWGYSAHKRVLEWMNVGIIMSLRCIGTRFNITSDGPMPEGSLIIVCNHQGMYDIPLTLLTFRRSHPKYISKVELSRGIPSISYALRNMGSVLIDRKDHAQALSAIEQFAKDTARLGHSACIFPEGTRARDGQMKRYKLGGLITLINHMPEAKIVPVAIAGMWRILRYKFLPVPFGVQVQLRVLPALERGNMSARELAELAEQRIREAHASLPN